MANTFQPVERMRLLSPALLVFLVSLAVSCATTMPAPREFLTSRDDSLNQWLDARVDVNLAELRVMHLPLTDAFGGMKLAITRADAPVEALRITLHANGVPRRQALWLIAQKYGLTLAVEQVPGQPSYISVSK